MQKIKLTLFILFAILLLPFIAVGQDNLPAVNDSLNKKDTLDYYDMSIEQLQQLKAVGVSSELEKLINSLIGVASKKPLSTRESPSIVSLITEEEIKNSGARDLIDVLNLVPGIDFGVDVEGIVGIGMRGNWAHEGKVLLLIDGQEINETLWASNQFGNHYSVEQIKKIEIIRGPGSAIYGGFGEYGVINIITKNGEDINGVSASAIYGQMKKDYGRRNIDLSFGKKIGDLQMSLATFIGQGNRSDQTFTDFYGKSYNMSGNANLDPQNLNLGLSYKGLSFRGIIDNYIIYNGDDYDTVAIPFKESFKSYYAELKYNWKINDKLTITPKVNFKEQTPWRSDTDPASAYYRIADRYTGNITASYNINRKINIIAGGEIYNDLAKDMVDSSYFRNGKNKINYLNEAFFVQGLFKTHIVNVIIGARYDNHSEYGSASTPILITIRNGGKVVNSTMIKTPIIPRVGLTKKIDKFNFKLLYSSAFRAPTIENIGYQDSTGIKPEQTNVLEFEAGYQISRNSIFTLNLFDITTHNAIVYYNQNGQDYYHNIGRTGSKGFEMEYKIKDKWGYIDVNYSFYNVSGKNKIADYEVPQNRNVLLAFPAHKINLNSSFNITKHLTLNPSVTFKGDRYAYTSVDSLGNSIAKKIDASVYLNIFIRYTDLFIKGLNMGIGVYNILDEKVQYIQPYNSNHAPLPGPSREFVVKLSYDLKLKTKEKSE